MARTGSGINIWTTGTSKGTALGQTVLIPASSDARILFYMNASGAPVGGPSYKQYKAATDVAYTKPAGSGESIWIYVQNDSGGTIQRGQTVKHKLDAEDWQVTTAGANEAVCGIAQYDIADGAYAYVLREGWGEALADATGGAKGALLAPDASGTLDVGVAGTDIIVGVAAETFTADAICGVFFRPVA